MRWVPDIRFLFICSALFVLACDSQPYQQGKALYEANCASCHMSDGSGLKALIPPLTAPEYLESQKHEVPCVIRYGLQGPVTVAGKTYDQTMAGHPELSVTQISNIINYIRNSWGNELGYYPPDSVQKALEVCSGREVIE